MRRILRTLALPFTSETVATGLGSLGVVLILLPYLYYKLGIHPRTTGMQTTVLISLAAPIPLCLAAASLWIGSGRRAYRDNTGSRAMCEFLGIFYTVMTIIACRHVTI